MADQENIADFDERKKRIRGNGGGGDFDSRLREVEILVARIEERTRNLASSSDIASMEARLLKWFLGTVIGCVVAGAAVARAFG